MVRKNDPVERTPADHVTKWIPKDPHVVRVEDELKEAEEYSFSCDWELQILHTGESPTVREQVGTRRKDHTTTSSARLRDLHKILWDERHVTLEDMERWYSQGICPKEMLLESENRRSVDSYPPTSETHEQMETQHSEDGKNAIVERWVERRVHQWGLVQTFGGPCGVLAVLQAELLVLLLFGQDCSCRLPTRIQASSKLSLKSMSVLRVYPTLRNRHSKEKKRLVSVLETGTDTTSNPDSIGNANSTETDPIQFPPMQPNLSMDVDPTNHRRRILQSMAMAIGWILARAALAPLSSTETDPSRSMSMMAHEDAKAESNCKKRKDFEEEVHQKENGSVMYHHQRHPYHSDNIQSIQQKMQEAMKVIQADLLERAKVTLLLPTLSNNLDRIVTTTTTAAATTTTTATTTDMNLQERTRTTASFEKEVKQVWEEQDHTSVIKPWELFYSHPLHSFIIELEKTPKKNQKKEQFHMENQNIPNDFTPPSLDLSSFLPLETQELLSHQYILSSSSSFLNDWELSFSQWKKKIQDSLRFHFMSILACSIADFLLSIDSNGHEIQTPQQSNHTCSDSQLNILHFLNPGGVILLTLSLILTRGIQEIQNDMDDPHNTCLTSQFGQCSQELMNLLLTGQAVSNVFDNTVTLYDGSWTSRGITSQPNIGYLTQLESLRYCQVGSFYKTPRYPVWVIGSTSHFSVMFSCSNDPLEENHNDLLLNQCRQAFTIVQGADENGFIPVTSLGDVLKTLGLMLTPSSMSLPNTSIMDPSDNNSNKMERITMNEAEKDALAASLEISGTGIIIWEDFWKAVSRLMTGVSLDNVLASAPSVPSSDDFSSYNFNQNSSATTDVSSKTDPLLLLTQYGESTNYMNPYGESNLKSDEQFARELQAQLDQEMSMETLNFPTSNLESLNHSMDFERCEVHTNNHSTEVKEIQSSLAEFPTALVEGPVYMNKDTPDDRDNFRLYYYNGLRGGRLTSFLVSRLESKNIVGSSVSLQFSSGYSEDTQQYTKPPGKGGCDLEEIVRTKWPSCKCDWKTGLPPSID